VLTIECTEDLLDFTIQNDTLMVSADPGYSGDCMVKLYASDGESQVFVEFTVSRDVTGNCQNLREILPLHVYPNPFNDHFSVELGNLENYEQVFLEVFDLSGRKLKTVIFDFSAGNMTGHHIDMSDVPNGVYIVNVRTGTLGNSVLVSKK
jgi:hypothetical protein